MNEIPVAHVRVQGINFVFIPLSQGMTRLTPSEQQSVVSELTKICRSANLAGSIVPAWPTISGVGFSCEPNVRSLLSQSLKLDFVLGNVNKKLKAPISAVLNKALFNNDGTENEGKTSDPHRGGLSLNNNNVQKNSSIKNDCPNKLLTMLFSDIVGSTKIKQQFGDSKAVSIIEDHHSIVREFARNHLGPRGVYFGRFILYCVRDAIGGSDFRVKVAGPNPGFCILSRPRLI